MSFQKKTQVSVGNEKKSWLRVAVAMTLIPTLLSFTGCKMLNESPKNNRIWFPTIAPPTKKEQEMRRYNYPEGGDPYLDSNVGPKMFDTRPRGWTDQRSKTAEVLGEYPDVNYD